MLLDDNGTGCITDCKFCVVHKYGVFALIGLNIIIITLVLIFYWKEVVNFCSCCCCCCGNDSAQQQQQDADQQGIPTDSSGVVASTKQLGALDSIMQTMEQQQQLRQQQQSSQIPLNTGPNFRPRSPPKRQTNRQGRFPLQQAQRTPPPQLASSFPMTPKNLTYLQPPNTFTSPQAIRPPMPMDPLQQMQFNNQQQFDQAAMANDMAAMYNQRAKLLAPVKAVPSPDPFKLPTPETTGSHESTGSTYFKQMFQGKKPVASISQYDALKKNKVKHHHHHHHHHHHKKDKN